MRSPSIFRRLHIPCLLATLSAPLLASAGQSCDEAPLSPAMVSKAMQTALNVTNVLDQRHDNVALLGRVGQDLSAYNLKYSHVGFIYRISPDAPRRVVHLLNACNTAESDLWYQGLGNFFLDDLFSYDSVAIIPPREVGDKLLQRFQNSSALRSVHSSRYSLVGYPFSTRYQNSNDWVLETLAATEARDASVDSREQAQAWLRLAGYKPSEMQVGALKRLGGRLFKANVAFDDHPSELRYSNRIQTVTVDSIMQFLSRRNEGWQIIEIPSLDGDPARSASFGK
ncbi:hypothetical protein BX604_3466 [Burkholderia sp. JKS000303]|nr:hypothetical protein BX604_3466 [Burkholderia sp. JKS000303]